MMEEFEQERIALLESPETWDRLQESLGEMSFSLGSDMLLEAIRQRCAPVAGSSGRALRLLDKAIPQLLDAAAPAVVCRVYPAERLHDGIVLNNTRFRGYRLGLAFRYCAYGIAYAMTLGPAVDRVIENARTKRETRGYLYDQAASRLAEYMAEQVSVRIKSLLPEPLGTTERYSPGYCDWHLSEQKKLFALLPPRPLGITLSKNCLMNPRKSISGVMGVGPAFVTQIYGNACLDCLHSSCRHRRMPAMSA